MPVLDGTESHGVGHDTYFNTNAPGTLMALKTGDKRYSIDHIISLAKATPGVVVAENTRHAKYVLSYKGIPARGEPPLMPCPIGPGANSHNIATWFWRATKYEKDAIYKAFERGAWN